jgi:hypothetical protein
MFQWLVAKARRWRMKTLKPFGKAAGGLLPSLGDHCGAKTHPFSPPPRGDLLALHAPPSPGTSRFEQRPRKPSWSVGVALAGALGVDWLAFREGPEARPES